MNRCPLCESENIQRAENFESPTMLFLGIRRMLKIGAHQDHWVKQYQDWPENWFCSECHCIFDIPWGNYDEVIATRQANLRSDRRGFVGILKIAVFAVCALLGIGMNIDMLHEMKAKPASESVANAQAAQAPQHHHKKLVAHE